MKHVSRANEQKTSKPSLSRTANAPIFLAPKETMDTEGHVLYALRNAPVRTWPYPHFYTENVFPEDTYAQIQDYLRAKTGFTEGKTAYQSRTFADADFPAWEFMNSEFFLHAVAKIFFSGLQDRFRLAGGKLVFTHDLRLVRDTTGYKIGPHTDAPWKVVSLLFYLPSDTFYQEHGTSIYTPKKARFECKGGPHHKFEDFNRIWAAPYTPNSCFGFFKTSNSFHGVEPIEAKAIRRDVLLYNLYAKDAQSLPQPNTE